MKIKKILSLLFVFVMAFAVCSTALAADEVPEGYIGIYNAEDFNNIRNDLDGKYILMDDIALGKIKFWEPIGTEAEPFTGVLDGNGNYILQLNAVIREDNAVAGLFGYIDGAEISDIEIVRSKIVNKKTSGATVGVLAAVAKNSEITGCTSKAKVSITAMGGKVIAGGLVGTATDCTIADCINYGTVNAVGAAKNVSIVIGGIAAEADNVSDCTNYGKVTAKSRFASVEMIADEICASSAENCTVSGKAAVKGK